MRSINLPYAKSLANRALLLKAVHGEPLPEPDALWSDDMHAMKRVLEPTLGSDGWRTAAAGPAGTAYRFGMAYWAAQPGARVRLTADERLRNRPILPLVHALQSMGARIEPDPLGFQIEGVTLTGGTVAVDARQSSQFASALLLSSPCFAEPVQLELPQGLTSAPYLAMTEAMHGAGARSWPPERDWSSAFVVLASVGLTGASIRLPGLALDSIQGDSRCAQWGSELGYTLQVEASGLAAHSAPWPSAPWSVAFGDTPDLAMPAIVAAALGGRSGRATGLQTLNAKESPRLDATTELLTRLGCRVRSGSDWLEWDAPQALPTSWLELDSYDDHRMAFCAALVSLRCPVVLRGSGAVAKSFPNFWSEWGLSGQLRFRS